MKLEKLHTDIADVLHRKTQLKTVLLYPSGRARVDVPAGLLELSEIEMGANPGTEELALRLTWALRILVDAGISKTAIVLQTLMVEAAHALFFADFDDMSTPTAFDFTFEAPQDAEAFAVGRLTWAQEAHFGTSIWAADPSFAQTVSVEMTNKGVQKC